MKTAKSYKILILLAVLFLSLITAFGFMNVKTVSADTVEPAVDFITERTFATRTSKTELQ